MKLCPTCGHAVPTPAAVNAAAMNAAAAPPPFTVRLDLTAAAAPVPQVQFFNCTVRPNF